MTGPLPPGDHLPVIKVINDSKNHAFVKIVNEDFSVTSVLFLSRSSAGLISNIPPGIYRVKYAFGGHLLADCQSISGNAEAGEFDELIKLATIKKQTRIEKNDGYEIQTEWQSSVVTLTLFMTADGKATSHEISVKSFNLD